MSRQAWHSGGTFCVTCATWGSRCAASSWRTAFFRRRSTTSCWRGRSSTCRPRPSAVSVTRAPSSVYARAAAIPCATRSRGKEAGEGAGALLHLRSCLLRFVAPGRHVIPEATEVGRLHLGHRLLIQLIEFGFADNPQFREEGAHQCRAHPGIIVHILPGFRSSGVIEQVRLLLDIDNASIAHEQPQHGRNAVGAAIGREGITGAPLGLQRQGHQALAGGTVAQAESIGLRPAQNAARAPNTYTLFHQYASVIFME